MFEYSLQSSITICLQQCWYFESKLSSFYLLAVDTETDLPLVQDILSNNKRISAHGTSRRMCGK